MTQDIQTLIQQLHTARQNAEVAALRKKEVHDRLMADSMLGLLTEAKSVADLEVLRIETALREAAHKQFLADGITKHPAYDVRRMTSFTVTDVNRAKTWCITNFTPAISLDQSMFLKAVKSGAIPEDLYKQVDESKIFIKSDLDKVLADASSPSN